MFNQISINFINLFIFSVITGVLFLGVCLSPAQGQGIGTVVSPQVTPTNSVSLLQELIKKLQEQLKTLNSENATSSITLKVGSDITVTDTLRVRSNPSTRASYIGVQPAGAKGVVVEGPIRADGHNWLKVDYETGPDGWNASGWLKKQVSYVGEQDIPETCTFEGRTYNNGERIRKNLSAATSSNVISPTDNALFECLSGQFRLVQSATSKTYIFGDIETITVENRGLSKGMFVRPTLTNYDLYTIKLKNGTIHTVQIFDTMSETARDAEFTKTGYVGAVKYLMNRARQIGTSTTATSTPTPRFSETVYADEKGNTKVKLALESIKNVNDVTGPVVLGSINWGDGTVSEPISALIRSAETAVTVNHVYKRSGNYEIVVTAKNGETITQSIVVNRVSPTPTPRPLTLTAPTPGTTTTYILTDISTVTKTLVDPNKAAIDDEYTLYTITLKNKKVHQVKVFGRQQPVVRDANFKKTGYTGDVVKLMALAKAVTTPTPTLRPTATTTPTPVVKGATTDAYAEILETLNNISIMLEQNK